MKQKENITVFNALKFGFGFYFGYEIAKQLDLTLGKILQEKIKILKEIVKDD